jgi:hypothetical protein
MGETSLIRILALELYSVLSLAFPIVIAKTLMDSNVDDKNLGRSVLLRPRLPENGFPNFRGLTRFL